MMGTAKRIGPHFLGLAMIVAPFLAPPAHAHGSKKTSPAELRADYLSRVQERDFPQATRTVGSLWTPGETGDLSTDFKARKLNDTVVIVVSVQTTAAQSGDVNSARAFQTNSAITGLAGDVRTKGLNPLLAANSSTTLKGAGATDSSTTFQTSMTGRVIAVLPSGNLVIEAQRKIFMNNQHEDVTVRGVVRPNDIGSGNTISSAALSDLEIELKGKGIIADSTRPPNRITRALLWLLGF
ncbi:MAG: flagellar basal body L-ring protein FlgH [Terracidiphilus sp.]|jgi:flagellar L-ring protein precursor FlgH